MGHFSTHPNHWGSGSSPGQGYVIQQVDIPSNKLLATAFEASFECIEVGKD